MNRVRFHLRQGGFTIIEILACMLLFVLGTLSIIGVVNLGLRSAIAAQSDATAWATALTVLKDPLPMGSTWDETTASLRPWTWTQAGSTWSASDAEGENIWRCTTWDIDLPSSILVSDMAAPVANNPAVFPAGGSPAVGCARGWLNGYYVERREQSRASDRMGEGMRIVEVRVDVYWSEMGSDGRALTSVIDRIVRTEVP